MGEVIPCAGWTTSTTNWAAIDHSGAGASQAAAPCFEEQSLLQLSVRSWRWAPAQIPCIAWRTSLDLPGLMFRGERVPGVIPELDLVASSFRGELARHLVDGSEADARRLQPHPEAAGYGVPCSAYREA